MENSPSTDLVTTLRHIIAQNKSQEDRLADYVSIVKSKDEEIEMLQNMLTEADEYRSSTDAQLIELQELKQYLKTLNDAINGVAVIKIGSSLNKDVIDDEVQQLNNNKPSYACLQVQLADLQSQLLVINNKNILLQQQVCRVAELESILSNIHHEKEDFNL